LFSYPALLPDEQSCLIEQDSLLPHTSV